MLFIFIFFVQMDSWRHIFILVYIFKESTLPSPGTDANSNDEKLFDIVWSVSDIILRNIFSFY